jgi:hypothetical protein
VFRFLDSPSGAEIAPPVSETDPSGLAEVAVTLGKSAGDQPVEARLDSPRRDVSVQFLLTAIPSNEGGGGGGDPTPPPPDDDGDGGGDDEDDRDNEGGGNDNDNSGRGNGNDDRSEDDRGGDERDDDDD